MLYSKYARVLSKNLLIIKKYHTESERILSHWQPARQQLWKTECHKLLHSKSSAKNKQSFYGPLIHDNPGEPVLLQMRELLKQRLEPPIMSKHYRFGRLLFYRHGISTPCLTNSVKSTEGNKWPSNCTINYYHQ